MIDQLLNENIFIRRYNYNDIDPFYEAARSSINEVYPWLPWCHPDYSKNETIEWVNYQINAWNEGREYEFVIVEKQSEQILGGCGLNQIKSMHKTANLGYWVRTGFTCKGIAGNAAMLAAKFGFTVLKLNRIEIVMAVDNIPSKRVAEKIGAVQEGIGRNRLLINEKICDAFIFSLIPADIFT